MNSVAKEIKDYWMRQSASFSWDAETLDLVSKSLNPEEVAVLEKGRDKCFAEGGEAKERYIFVVNKAFNRHNDIICHYTEVSNDGSLRITERSSITELNIRVDTLINCNRNCVYHINEFETTLLPAMTLDAIADLTNAIVMYNEEHKGEVR